MNKGWKGRLFRMLGVLGLFGLWHGRNGVIVLLGLVFVLLGRFWQIYYIFDEDNSAVERSDAGEEMMVFGLAFLLYGLLSWVVSLLV